MSLGTMFGVRTWIGLAVSVILLLLCVMAGALLLVQGMLPASMQPAWVYASCALAAFIGGLTSQKGEDSRSTAFLTALLLYALLWIIALASSVPLAFGLHGSWITGTILGGGLLASAIGKKKGRKKRGKHSVRGTAKRRSRMVT